jgi:hypothetical protein
MAELLSRQAAHWAYVCVFLIRISTDGLEENCGLIEKAVDVRTPICNAFVVFDQVT